MKLLIVDDEPIAIQGVMHGVDWSVLDFHEILQANSYAQAVQLLSQQHVDVALCDIEMPDENGLLLIEWIREHFGETECIILSCHDKFDYARQAISLGCMEYVTKPVRYDYLTQVLQRAIHAVRDKQQQRALEDYGKIYMKSLSPDTQEQSSNFVDTVTDYIDRHPQEDLNVTILAKMAYVSPDHLTRTFKKEKGVTVSDYIKYRRMITAKHLLLDRKVTITQVAEMVGYSNYSYFIEQFKKFTGMTPKAYQKQYSKE